MELLIELARTIFFCCGSGLCLVLRAPCRLLCFRGSRASRRQAHLLQLLLDLEGLCFQTLVAVLPVVAGAVLVAAIFIELSRARVAFLFSLLDFLQLSRVHLQSSLALFKELFAAVTTAIAGRVPEVLRAAVATPS